MEEAAFVFHDPGRLIDGELEVVLAGTVPADPVRGWAPTYDFAMRVGEETVGFLSLRIGGGEYIENYIGHVGYRVQPAFRGRRYAGRTVALIVPLAFRHGIDPLWITCNPDNLPSRRTLERLGAEMVAIVDVPPGTPLYERGEKVKCRYRLKTSP